MKEKLVRRDTLVNFKIYQMPSNRYLIKGITRKGNKCIFHQIKNNKWILSYDGTRNMILDTKIVKQILKQSNTISI